MDFDTERFIAEVKRRPMIWNSKCSEYSDKNLRRKAWEEIAEIYAKSLPLGKKRQIGIDLQKRWRNIRDAFVKTHKAKENENKIGSSTKKKVPYVYYENLLFLKDIGYRIHSSTTSTRGDHTTAESISDTDNNTPLMKDDPIAEEPLNHIDSSNTTLIKDEPTTDEDDLPLWRPLRKRSKRNNDDDNIGDAQIEVTAKNTQRKDLDDDDARLFFLSIINDFKKIPQYMQMQTKIDILRVIKDAQR